MSTVAVPSRKKSYDSSPGARSCRPDSACSSWPYRASRRNCSSLRTEPLAGVSFHPVILAERTEDRLDER
jgi:hypothetical protein